MTRLTIDWLSAALNGRTTLTSADVNFVYEVSTPRNGDGRQWTLATLPEGGNCLSGAPLSGPLVATVTFGKPVANVAFEVCNLAAKSAGNPATNWHDVITIIALNADGTQVPVMVSKALNHTNVAVSGPVVSLKIIYSDTGTPAAAGGIGIGDITFEPNTAGSTGRAVPDDAMAVAQSGDVLTRCHDASDRKFDALNLRRHGIRKIAMKDGVPDGGIVTFLDNTTLSFADIERLIPCFTPGTMIATPKGEILVENLKVGDRVLTRDNGIKTINWVGTKRLDYLMLKQLPELRPIRIKRGALGPNIPDRDMLVSPAHRMLVVSQVAQLYFNQSEVLIAAKHLLEIEGVEVAQTAYVTYIHFMCEHHEIVLSDGAWSESFQPGDYSLKGLDSDQREELFALFPHLSTKEGILAYRAARPTLKKEEAALIFKGR